MSLCSLTDKRSTLAASADTYFYIKDCGQYFEKLVYPDFLIISLNWRFQKSQPLTENIEVLRNEHESNIRQLCKCLRELETLFLDKNMCLGSFKQLLVTYLIMISLVMMVDLMIQSIR